MCGSIPGCFTDGRLDIRRRQRNDQAVSQLARTPIPMDRLNAALDRLDFEEADVILKGCHLNTRQDCRQLAAVGMEVRQLDAEEFGHRAEDCCALPGDVREFLEACSWPKSMADLARVGALKDLKPTYRLLLELIDLNVQQRNWTEVLALIHLMAEYLPLLAWQPILGHAGLPGEVAQRFDPAGKASPRPPKGPRCAFGPQDADLAIKLTKAPRDGGELRDYLLTRHSRLSNMLLICGGTPGNVGATAQGACKSQCSVVTGTQADLADEEREDLARRATLARRFAKSPIVQLRHSSPVGHFFAVPSRQEIELAWGATRKSLHRAMNDMQFPDPQRRLLEGSLPTGLAGLVGLCAGSQARLEASTVLPKIRDAIRQSIGTGN